jgi:hypothetical protein
MDVKLEVSPANTGQSERPLSRRRNGFLPTLTLFFLAPLVGEVLLGSTPLDVAGSPAIFVFLFLMEVLLYGAGAVLIREITRRTGHGWPTIVGLGMAYGIVEESLITQTFFNNNYLGFHFLDYANFLGLGWLWMTHLIPLHAVWSISVPILLTELLFRDRGTNPWLGKVGLAVVGVIFVLGALILWLATYASENSFLAPWPELGGAAIVAAVVAAIALRLPKRTAGTDGQVQGHAPNPWAVGVVAFVAASLFMAILHAYELAPDLPGIVAVAFTVALVVAIFALIFRWSAQSGWASSHLLALGAAALFTYAWIGFFNFSPADRIDLAGQVVVDVLAVALVFGLARKVTAQPAA